MRVSLSHILPRSTERSQIQAPGTASQPFGRTTRVFVTATAILIFGLPATFVQAQLSRHPAVKRYDRVARGANVEEWERRLLDPKVKIRLEAVESLGEDGSEESVPGLIDALADPDHRVQVRALDYLGSIGDPRATPVIMQFLFLSHVEKPTKLRALTALGRMKDPTMSEPLLNYAASVPDADLASRAVYAIGELGDPAVEDRLREMRDAAKTPEFARLCDDAINKIEKQIASAPGRQPTLIELEKRFAPPAPK
jgi:HEAT repeat protein